MARRSVVIDLEVRNQQARKALQGVEGGFTRLSQKTQQSTTAMSQGFQRSSQQIQGSTTAVSNLSRIVEDAPFGIRGVANNINPFIQSFQRLQGQTGSTTTAMKTLLTSAFTGPGALLTISALVTSAMTAIQMGLFDLGEEAEDTLEDIEGLLGSFERTIELQDQFGAFEDDEFGIAETQAQIREITEDLAEHRDDLERLNQLEEQRSEIIRQRPDPTTRTEEQRQQLAQIDREMDLLSSEEDIQEEIESLVQERLQLSIDLVNTSEALADEDTQQAQQQQKAREEQEKRTEAAQSELEAARALTRARREMAAESRGQGAEFLGPAEIDTGLDTGVADTPMGSIADLQRQRKDLQEGFITADTEEERKQFAEDIEAITGEIEEMKGGLEDAGESGEQSIDAATAAANMLGNALAQAVVRGEDLEGVLKSLAAQLASRAIVTGLGALLTGGASLGGSTFLSAMFGGFADGTDMGFPGIGRVGERGEELLVAPPMSSVITNENVEKMDKWRSEARQGAANVSAMGGNQMEGAVMNALSKWNIDSETRVEGRDFVTMIRKELNQQGGKGGNGTI